MFLHDQEGNFGLMLIFIIVLIVCFHVMWGFFSFVCLSKFS